MTIQYENAGLLRKIKNKKLELKILDLIEGQNAELPQKFKFRSLSTLDTPIMKMMLIRVCKSDERSLLLFRSK